VLQQATFKDVGSWCFSD